MQEIKIHPKGPHISRLVYGAWRMLDGGLTEQDIERNIQTCIDLGINWFDHADIYGNYGCEEFFGTVYKKIKSKLPELHFVTKTDIMLFSDKYPNRKVKHYDSSPKHIEESVNNSLRNLGIEKIDILLLHRPDPLLNADETGVCLDQLIETGKVSYVGVSNFTPSQVSLLQSRMKNPLITNQIEISLKKIDPFINGDIDFLYQQKIRPMSWSPLGGGSLMRSVADLQKNASSSEISKHEKAAPSLSQIILDLTEKYHTTENAIALAWLLRHPSGIIPVIGSNSAERIQQMAKSLDIILDREDWFLLYQAALGKEVP
jgi:predicted oxidoreductase